MAGNDSAGGGGGGGDIIELNVGGVYYTTSRATLTSGGPADGILASVVSGTGACRDGKGRFFIDRDGVLFRYVLDFLRNGKVILPDNFHERERLRFEAEHYGLAEMAKQVSSGSSSNNSLALARVSSGVAFAIGGGVGGGGVINNLPSPAANAGGGSLHSNNSSASLSQMMLNADFAGEDKYAGYITVGYRGTFASGREGMGDVKFRKLTRILVCGRVSLCRQAFGDTLNESRDPDRGLSSRYTSRFFLKHSSLEQAFENLQEAGFVLVSACASGTSGGPVDPKQAGGAVDSEENRWNHYNEFVFSRS